MVEVVEYENAAEKIAEHGGLLQDTYTWILFSAIIFSFILYKKGKKPILDILDGRSARIKSELDEAERLRGEAQKLLIEYQQMQNSAKEDAEKIIKAAEEYALSLSKKADTKLEEQIERREKLLLARISRAETSAIEEVKYQAADIAIEAAESILKETMSKNDIKLIDESIKDLPKKFA